MIKVGDNVRFLNSVGGGVVVRIQDNIAYVDEDGFETPVLLRECVLVGAPAVAKATAPKSTPRVEREEYTKAQKIFSKDTTPQPTALPVVETAGGDVVNITLGFEPQNIKSLSQSGFDAYLVNDSNYYLFVAVSTRANEDSNWTLRYQGVIEPNIQEFVFELFQQDLPKFDRMLVQYVAFKQNREFAPKQPGDVELKVDATKFAKLHCFRPNQYFDGPVIAFEITGNDRPAVLQTLDSAQLAQGILEKKRQVNLQNRRDQAVSRSKSSKPVSEIIEVDLHAAELLDNVAGLGPADILNAQIDRFSEIMEANLRRPGQKIVFIHGKGEGVLRQAIMKELKHRYKGHDVQDASFREYGFGATQVTIKGSNSSTNRRK